MNLFKSYALCISTGKIKMPNDKYVDKYKCQIFKNLEEANNERNLKNPLEFKIIEIYRNKYSDNKTFKMELTYNCVE